MKNSTWFLVCLLSMGQLFFGKILVGQSPNSAKEIKSPASLSMREIGHAASKLAKDEIDLFYPRCFDSKRGGFHQTLAKDWTLLPDDNCSIVAQSRHIWTCAAYSKFTASPAESERLKNQAIAGLEFLDRAFWDEQEGGYYWAIGADGKPNERIGYLKHSYGAAFAIYAAAEVFSTTRHVVALKVCQRAFDWLESHAYDSVHGGYYDCMDRAGKPILEWDPNLPLWQRQDPLGTYYGFKTMNSHIHLLEAFSELHRIDSRPIVRQRLVEVFELVRDRIVVAPGALCLFFTPDWRATAAHDSFGHDIETAYLLMEAAHSLANHSEVQDQANSVVPKASDEKTLKVARQLVDHALDWGFDHDIGGFYDKGDAFGTMAYDKTKVWWVQAEGLNALALMEQSFGDDTDRYRIAIQKQWSFIEKHSVDRERGGWYWETTAEGQPTGQTQKANSWKAAYHTGRSMMNVSRLLKDSSR